MLLLTRVVLLSALCAVALGCPRIVSRRQWRAQPPKYTVPLKTPVPYVIVNHTAGKRCTSLASCSKVVRAIQSYDMYKGLADIRYNFLIGEDGRVYEGRGWSTRGAHKKGFNNRSLGLAFLGNFTKTSPKAAALKAISSLIRCAVSKRILSPNYILKLLIRVVQSN